jgi:hypothetical protein
MENNINNPEINLEQGEKTARKDKFNFPVPGHSMTDTPKKWAWDNPPNITNPDDAVEMVINKVEDNPDTKEHFLRMMAGGVTVEEIINTIGLGGFTEGEWSPDVAELIKPALAVYFIGLAIKNKVPVIAFSEKEIQEENRMISKSNTLKMMKEKNPKEFENVKASLVAKNKASMQPPVEEQEQGFIDMEVS